MTIDIRSLALIFSLTTVLEVVILGAQFRREKRYIGFLWLIIGIALIGLHFFLVFLQTFTSLGIFVVLLENITLVASISSILYGMIRFFYQQKRKRAFIIFGLIYAVISLLAFFLDNAVLIGAVSAGIISAFSFIIALIIYTKRFDYQKHIAFFGALTFFLNGLLFLVNAILWLIPPYPGLSALPTPMQRVLYIALFNNATLWTFGFIYLMNQRSLVETVESKEKFNLMFGTIPDAVLITRLSDGLLVEANQGFTKLSGYTTEEIEGKTTLDINIWFDPAERSRFVVLLTETGAIENMEFQFRRKNGRPLIGLISSRTIVINREPHVFSVVRDITSRKKMEDKLRENEQKYRFLTENSGDVIWHINKSYRIDYISPADELIRGFKREEVIGTQIWSIFKPEGVQLVREKIEHHHNSEQIGNNTRVTRFEIEQLCKDGNYIWTEIVAAPHYDRNATLIGYHGISRDITERKKMVDQLYLQATTDELTQIPNRRHFMNLAEIELRRAKRYHHPLSIVVVDFDGLKNINDTYGHSAGDRALTVFAKIVQQIIRDVDVLGRFGGDEFLILLPETDTQKAELVMDRINNVLATSPVFYGENSFKVSVSSGIASIVEWTDTLKDLFDRADDALYESKQEGVNGFIRHSRISDEY